MNNELLKYFDGDDLAAPVWQRKYAIEGEIIPDDMHKRMAKEFSRVELKYGGIETPMSKKLGSMISDYGKKRDYLTQDRIYELFKNFKYLIPQGSIMSQLGSPSIGSLSNCFVVGQPYDSYGGIMQKDQELVQLMKRRGGVGLDLSTLRPSGTLTTNAAKSSTGAVSFMERFSNSTREVAQNGRRGALMLSMDVRHPDVASFAVIKNDPTKVTGANISIFLRDDFMEAVEQDGDYWLQFPCEYDISTFTDRDNEPYDKIVEHGFYQENGDLDTVLIKRIKAKKLYDQIINSAWLRAEPGQLFLDRMHNYSPDSVYPQYKGVTTNPCSEIFMQMYDACRLLVTNLFSFVIDPFTPHARFDYEKFYQYNYEAQRLMDDIVDLELEHIDRILQKINLDPEPLETKYVELRLWTKVREVAAAGRRTGTGITALGDTLAALGLKYDSDGGIEVIERIMAKKMESELDCTIDLGILRGTFEGWDPEKEFGETTTGHYGKNEFYQFILHRFPEQAYRMIKWGRRNISWSTIAPTGTVSLMTQTSSGLEPLFSPFYTRRVKVNPNDKSMRVDFTDQTGDQWMEIPVLHPKFKMWYNTVVRHEDGLASEHLTKDILQNAFEKSPWYGSTANDIDWGKRVKIQGIIQKYISHSISSTINLPNNVTEKEVADIYIASWREGLKGVTVYRDGCRSGVLVTDTEKPGFEYRDAPKRPNELPGEAYCVTALGEKFTVIVGLLDNKPYEVFAFAGNGTKDQGIIKKVKKGEYDFVQGDKGDETVRMLLEGSDEQIALTRMISTALRHGADIKYVVEQLNKADGTIVSFSKAVARTLKRYIPDGTKSTVKCNDCGSGNVIFEEGCNKCLDCGSSKCG